MTLIIADPALTAAPVPLAGSAARTRDLRAELADAIQNRRAAEAIAADAKRLSDRGERAKADANMVVNQLKHRLDAAQNEATKADAEALTAARAGQSPAFARE